MKPIGKFTVLLVVAAAIAAVFIARGVKQRSAAGDDTTVVARSSAQLPANAVVAAQAPIPKLVCVGSGKCIPCKAMEPVREQLKKDYAGKLLVEFHEISADRDVIDRFSIQVIPTSIFYDASGQEVDRVEGFIDQKDILARFARAGVSL